ncbi:pentatricopeptide repeat-containing protein At1g11290, chloroplastic [Selaginella moellendorffii]|nr:pentatricopeptide repeat-containing protein At1g11290, chloroplastic [Selaginella moellendorffii]|eukprot:XP_002980702.2 pentatricopeptide repeat-containing protein At1g11290, chloroplastic [Selaginella moellendorffii]
MMKRGLIIRQLCSLSGAVRVDRAADLQEYTALLQSCVDSNDLAKGKRAHELIANAGLEQHLFLGNCLINMYVRCGSLEEAHAIFSKMEERNVVSWTALISANAQSGAFARAFALFRTMLLESSAAPNSYTLVAMLNACANSRDLAIGRSIHAMIWELGLERESTTATLVGNAMINMYAKCGSPEDAIAVFLTIPEKDVVSWTAMAGAYAQERRFYPDALRIFREMLLQPLAPNVITFITALGACTSLRDGTWLHSLLHEAGLGFDPLAGNALINMYGKCGDWEGAYGVFKAMASRQELDLVSWNAMISASVEAGRHGDAMAIFRRLRLEGMRPNSVTLITILNALAASGVDFGAARKFHGRIWESGYLRDVVVGNAIISMYAKCGFFSAAWTVFRRIRWKCDVISWNTMLGASEDRKSFGKVVNTFHHMLLAGIDPNKVSFIAILNACSNSEALDFGRKIHSLILTRRRDYVESSVATMLVSMYGKCGSIAEAELVFKEMPLPSRSLVTWNVMLGAYAQNDRSKEAFGALMEMLQGGVLPDALSFTSVLSSCYCSQEAQVLRMCILESGYRSACLETALISMHGRCRELEQARSVFDEMDHGDVVSWTAMVSATAENRDFKEVHHLFRRMQLEGVIPDKFTLATTLDTCLDSTTLGLGKIIHACVTEIGLEADIAVENALLNMYSNCGDWREALSFFETMKARDLVSWNIMSAAYAQAGLAKEAVLLFRHMQLEGVKPDKLTFSTTLNVSGGSALVSDGKLFHGLAAESGLDSDVSVATGLVKLYAKCGKLDEAISLFRGACQWTVVLLNAIIGALAQHGFSEEAVKMFWKMQQEGVRPDVATLVSIISACGHAGMVEEGCSSFLTMKEYFGISPTLEHYACFVDLLGRAGQLEHAEQIIRKMPFEDNTLVWTSLLGTCKLQGDAELGERCAQRILELDPHNSAAHVVLSNIYCATGKWKDADVDRKKLLDQNVKNAPGMSWLEIGKQVHEFVAGDRSHPQTDEIYVVLDKLELLMRRAGYEADKGLDAEDELKEKALGYHSERIAIAFGLIATPPDTTLKIVKNLRVCGDCHTATKYISMIMGREIIVRDSLRFHHFSNGTCSCKDCW